MNISSWILSVIKLDNSSLTIISWGRLKTLSLMSDSFNLELNLFAWKYTLDLELNEQSKTDMCIYVLDFQTGNCKKKIHSERTQWNVKYSKSNVIIREQDNQKYNYF